MFVVECPKLDHLVGPFGQKIEAETYILVNAYEYGPCENGKHTVREVVDPGNPIDTFRFQVLTWNNLAYLLNHIRDLAKGEITDPYENMTEDGL